MIDIRQENRGEKGDSKSSDDPKKSPMNKKNGVSEKNVPVPDDWATCIIGSLICI